MLRAAYHGKSWRPDASVGVGVGYVSGTDPNAGHVTDTMLALSLAVGVAYRLTNVVALGPFVQYKPCFEPALNQFWDFGVALTWGG